MIKLLAATIERSTQPRGAVSRQLPFQQTAAVVSRHGPRYPMNSSTDLLVNRSTKYRRCELRHMNFHENGNETRAFTVSVSADSDASNTTSAMKPIQNLWCKIARPAESRSRRRCRLAVEGY